MPPPGQSLLPALKVKHYGRIPPETPQTDTTSSATPGPNSATASRSDCVYPE